MPCVLSLSFQDNFIIIMFFFFFLDLHTHDTHVKKKKKFLSLSDIVNIY